MAEVESEVLPPIVKKRHTFPKGHKFSEPYKWKPGQSGNPAGPPKGIKSFKNRLLDMACKNINYKDIGGKKINGELGEAIATALCGRALKGDMKALNLILEYTKDKDALVNAKTVNNIGLVNVTDARSNIARVLELAARAGATSLSIEDELA